MSFMFTSQEVEATQLKEGKRTLAILAEIEPSQNVAFQTKKKPLLGELSLLVFLSQVLIVHDT